MSAEITASGLLRRQLVPKIRNLLEQARELDLRPIACRADMSLDELGSSGGGRHMRSHSSNDPHLLGVQLQQRKRRYSFGRGLGFLDTRGHVCSGERPRRSLLVQTIKDSNALVDNGENSGPAAALSSFIAQLSLPMVASSNEPRGPDSGYGSKYLRPSSGCRMLDERTDVTIRTEDHDERDNEQGGKNAEASDRSGAATTMGHVVDLATQDTD